MTQVFSGNTGLVRNEKGFAFFHGGLTCTLQKKKKSITAFLNKANDYGHAYDRKIQQGA